MFSHVVTGVADFDRAFAFYDALFGVLDMELRFCERGRPWAGWQPCGGGRPLFVISTPFDGRAHERGNGQMVAFAAANRRRVREAHRVALEAGGHCEGAPGLRPLYHPDYYGAYLRDPDGNKICVVSHGPGQGAGPEARSTHA